jgi:uridine kinase
MTVAPQLTATEPEEVIEAILADYSVYDGPLGSYAVAVSGPAGAGKSTLTRQLQAGLARVPGIGPVVPFFAVDWYTIGACAKRGRGWPGYNWLRWQEEVLDPIYLGEAITCTIRDWESGQVVGEISAPPTPIRLLEGVGLFHPSRLPYLRSRVWVDCDLDVAQALGIERSLAHGRHEHVRLWRNVWGPNDRDFIEAFHPEKEADILYNWDARSS